MRAEPSKSNFITNLWGVVCNAVETRTNFLRRWMDTSVRNIESECGHPEVVDIWEMKKAFLRGDVAKRVVTLYPEESWETPPEIYETEDETETEFEKVWKSLDSRLQLSAFFLRADILSGVGKFGVILLGIDDGLGLEQPVQGVDLTGKIPANQPDGSAPAPASKITRQLMYLRCFDETFIQIKTLNSDPKSARFGQPEMYSIEFASDQLQGAMGVAQSGQQTQFPSAPGSTTRREVHWTRIIHLADNRLNNDIYGAPRMEVVYNRILDLKKITGGSGEMFWKGGFPGLALEAQIPTDGAPVQFDKEATREEMEKYMNGLQRFISLIGMQAKSLTVEVADPKPHADLQLSLIAIALACPLRVFMGSEEAKLASGQDIISWNDRMMRRRESYISPFMIRPFITRCQAMGILPQTADDAIHIEWDDMNAIERASQRATYAMNQTSALTAYLSAGGDQLIPPFEFLTLLMGLTDDEARSCIDEAGDNLINTDPAEEHQQALDMINAKANAAAQSVAALGANGGRKNASAAQRASLNHVVYTMNRLVSNGWVTIDGNHIFIPDGPEGGGGAGGAGGGTSDTSVGGTRGIPSADGKFVDTDKVFKGHDIPIEPGRSSVTQEVKIKDLIATQDYTGLDKVKSLVQDFDESKFTAPSIVRAPDGGLRIYDGHHSILARFAMGHDTVKAKIFSPARAEVGSDDE